MYKEDKLKLKLKKKKRNERKGPRHKIKFNYLEETNLSGGHSNIDAPFYGLFTASWSFLYTKVNTTHLGVSINKTNMIGL